MASHSTPSYLRDKQFSFLIQSSLMLTQVAGSPVPPSTDSDYEKFHPEVRSLTGDGPLEKWEIALLILGCLFGVMILGFLGGICEVVLGGKIKQSNAEADAKLEGLGSRGMAGEDGVMDKDRYSWQPERMGTGLSDDSTLAGSDPGASQSDMSRGEVEMTFEGDYDRDPDAVQQTGEQYSAWNGGESLPHPDSSRFVIDDVDSPGFERPRDDSQGYEAYPGHHLNPPPPAVQRNNDYQGQGEAAEYYNGGGDGTFYPDSSEAGYVVAASDGHAEQSAVPPPGAYSGEGYSPAVMPDSADYLNEYRQSQLYLQQDEDWYASASAQYGDQAGGAPAGTAH